MTTRQVMVGSDWSQLTTGTESIQCQVSQGMVMVRDEAKKPASNAIGHPMTGWFQVTPPSIVWVKATGSARVRLIIS